MGNYCFGQDKKIPEKIQENQKKLQEKQRKYWEWECRQNTEFIVRELLAFHKQGVFRGELSVQQCYETERVKKIMKTQHNVIVVFHDYHKVGDFYGEHDKLFFIMFQDDTSGDNLFI